MDIFDNLKQIKNAVKGKDVRQAIHDSIEQCYNDATGNTESNVGIVRNMGTKASRLELCPDFENKTTIDSFADTSYASMWPKSNQTNYSVPTNGFIQVHAKITEKQSSNNTNYFQILIDVNGTGANGNAYACSESEEITTYLVPVTQGDSVRATINVYSALVSAEVYFIPSRYTGSMTNETLLETVSRIDAAYAGLNTGTVVSSLNMTVSQFESHVDSILEASDSDTVPNVESELW